VSAPTLTSRAAIHGAARADARTPESGTSPAPARFGPARPRGAGDTLTAATLREFAVEVEALRDVPLTADECAELDVLAFGHLRAIERRAEDEALRRAAIEVARMREPALIASMGAPGAAVQPWEGVIGAEGRLTGDHRLIEFGALTWADFPLPLRYAPADLGGHDGAVLVGRIDAVTRGDDGLIHGRGVLDLGSPIGREVVRLIRAGMLSGVSMDIDSTDQADMEVEGARARVIAGGRVRGATLLTIPAFDVARIALVDDPAAEPPPPAEDCGCEPPTDPGLYTFDHPAPIPATAA
jgi:Phage head maturation protease